MFKLKHKLLAMAVGMAASLVFGAENVAAEGKYLLRRLRSRFCYSNKGNKAKKHLTFGKKHFKLLALSGYGGGYATVWRDLTETWQSG